MLATARGIHRSTLEKQKEITIQKHAYVPKSLASEKSVQNLAVFHMHFSGKKDPGRRDRR